MIKYESHSYKLIKVTFNGDFAGWLNCTSHKPTGIATKRYNIWEGKINGVDFRSTVLSEIKNKINRTFI